MSQKIKHPFRKKWGQNFLIDNNVINNIIDCLDASPEDIILEIGPGDGSLTNILYKKVKEIYAIEIDPLLYKVLLNYNYPNVKLFKNDFLKWDLQRLPINYKVISNLPYYIASTILFKLIEYNKWNKMILMFQKELADRITSKPGNKVYGRLSVMCQVFCKVKIQFTVSKNVFNPKPEVDSAILEFAPKKTNLISIHDFGNLVRQAFSQRRKKLKNNLPKLHSRGILMNLSDLRPEELAPKDYIEIFNKIQN